MCVCVCEELHSGWQHDNCGTHCSLYFGEASPGARYQAPVHSGHPAEHAPAWHVPGAFHPASQFPQLDLSPL